MAINLNITIQVNRNHFVSDIFNRDDVVLYVPLNGHNEPCRLDKCESIEAWAAVGDGFTRRSSAVGKGDYSQALVALRGNGHYYLLANSLGGASKCQLESWYGRLVRMPHLDLYRPKIEFNTPKEVVDV